MTPRILHNKWIVDQDNQHLYILSLATCWDQMATAHQAAAHSAFVTAIFPLKHSRCSSGLNSRFGTAKSKETSVAIASSKPMHALWVYSVSYWSGYIFKPQTWSQVWRVSKFWTIISHFRGFQLGRATRHWKLSNRSTPKLYPTSVVTS